MVDGVFPLAHAVRPLGLSGPATWSRWRLEHAGSRPRGIGVFAGCARTGCQSDGWREGLVSEFAQRVVAALEQLASDGHAGAITAEAGGGLVVVGVVGT